MELLYRFSGTPFHTYCQQSSENVIFVNPVQHKIRIAKFEIDPMRMLIRSTTIWMFVMCLVVTAIAGCGEPTPELVTVRGRVFFDGSGVTAGSLYFHPNADAGYTKDQPSSMLQKDGSFSMKTFPFGDGVAPGTYKVTLTPELASRLQAPQYGTVEKTPWEVTVPAEGIENLTLTISR